MPLTLQVKAVPVVAVDMLLACECVLTAEQTVAQTPTSPDSP